VNQQENGSCYELVSITIRGLTGLSRRIVYMGLYHRRISHRFFFKHISRKLLDIMMGFAAGAMIFVVVEELIPDSQTNGNTDVATLGLMVGFVIIMILDVALG